MAGAVVKTRLVSPDQVRKQRIGAEESWSKPPPSPRERQLRTFCAHCTAEPASGPLTPSRARERGFQKSATIRWNAPLSPAPPRSCLAGRGATSAMVGVSRCARPERECRKMIFPVCLSCYAWGRHGLFCPTSACPSADKVVDRLFHPLGGRCGCFDLSPVGLSGSHLPRIAGVSVVAA